MKFTCLKVWAGVLVLSGACHAADLTAFALAPGEPAARAAARLAGNRRWIGLGDTLVVEGAARGGRPIAVPAGTDLALVLSKHAAGELPAPLTGTALVRHSGLTLAALVAGSRRDATDVHVAVRPVPWNRAVSETLVPVSRAAPDAAITALASNVTAAGVRADIEKLVSFKSRHSLSNGYRDAVAWAEAEFGRMGMTTRRHAFSLSGRTSENLIAELPGQAGVDDVYVVGGHLDSISFSGGIDNAPGADDNGSGSACTLAIARALAGTRPRATIRFILFGGEEEGLVGSKAYVRSLSAAERARIKGALIMDMTGFRKGVAGVTLEGREVSRPLSDLAADVTARYTALKIERSFEAWGSDHVPFLEAEIPTLLTIELDYPVNGNEHGPRDTMQIVDVDQAVAIARADLAILATLNGLGTAR